MQTTDPRKKPPSTFRCPGCGAIVPDDLAKVHIDSGHAVVSREGPSTPPTPAPNPQQGGAPSSQTQGRQGNDPYSYEPRPIKIRRLIFVPGIGQVDQKNFFFWTMGAVVLGFLLRGFV